MNLDSPAEIRALLSERGLALKKRWGQNFLVNRGARERLIAVLDPRADDRVWEIGPGLGAMTESLVQRVAALVAFEVDRGLCRYLEERFAGVPSFRLVPGDFLETWKGEMAGTGAPSRILGNLPYASASLMIADLIESGARPRAMVFTVQKELAERIASAPGRKSYSSFSVLCQSCFAVAPRGNLQPGSFYPAPDVVSSVIEMTPLTGAPEGRVLETLSLLLRGLFSSRRKTIRNNVAACRLGLPSEEILAAAVESGIDPSRRAEELEPAAFIRLARTLTGRANA
ncbi:MAG TPA: 16S rRNA (adenine(1518)-N(6)/adenine(1519)-N(6))-dimethyltransferase RsmA [Spirochaetia bacterium]